ncbi:NAD-binding protein [Clostridiaceae bacterium 35-E11]
MKHVIIGGDSYISSLFIRKLINSIKNITVVYPEIKYVESLPGNFKGNLVIGNFEDEVTLENANISNEDTVLIWSQDEDINALLAVAVKKVHNVKNTAVYSCGLKNSELYKKLDIELINIESLFNNELIMPIANKKQGD